jgi:hypothetical protein
MTSTASSNSSSRSVMPPAVLAGQAHELGQNCRRLLLLACLTTARSSSSSTNVPWARTSLDCPGGRKSMSPCPISTSPPFWSSTMRESSRGDAERDAAGQVGLDQAGDDVGLRPLRRDDQVDADGAALLGDAAEVELDLLRRWSSSGRPARR